MDILEMNQFTLAKYLTLSIVYTRFVFFVNNM